MLTIQDFPRDGFYWLGFNDPGRAPSIVQVKTHSDHPGNQPRGVLAKSVQAPGLGGEWPLISYLNAHQPNRAKIIDPATDLFAPEFGAMIRRAGECLFSGRIVADIAADGVDGARRTLAEIERQANAAGGPLRLWINDAPAPIDATCPATSGAPYDAESECVEFLRQAIGEMGFTTVRQLLDRADRPAAPVEPVAAGRIGGANASDVPAGAKRTGRAEDATGDEWEG